MLHTYVLHETNIRHDFSDVSFEDVSRYILEHDLNMYNMASLVLYIDTRDNRMKVLKSKTRKLSNEAINL